MPQIGYNSVGTFETTKTQVFQAYDSLPSTIRIALSKSNRDWIPQKLIEFGRTALSAGYSVKEVEEGMVKIVDRWNQEDKDKYFKHIEDGIFDLQNKGEIND